MEGVVDMDRDKYREFNCKNCGFEVKYPMLFVRGNIFATCGKCGMDHVKGIGDDAIVSRKLTDFESIRKLYEWI
jgi:hypothetical protein